MPFLASVSDNKAARNLALYAVMTWSLSLVHLAFLTLGSRWGQSALVVYKP